VVDADGRLKGMVTDGDLRRAFSRDIANLTATDIMSAEPITISPDARMSDVIDRLATHKISSLFVVEDGRPVATAHIAELMLAGYVA
jgi:arabinose-5-phosphate isomerase